MSESKGFSGQNVSDEMIEILNIAFGIPTSPFFPCLALPLSFMLIVFFSLFQMMECGQCKCWVHAKCEGLSDEKYQVLSYLPESVEFICRFVILSCTSIQDMKEVLLRCDSQRILKMLYIG
jgi:hypothetical protein